MMFKIFILLKNQLREIKLLIINRVSKLVMLRVKVKLIKIDLVLMIIVY